MTSSPARCWQQLDGPVPDQFDKYWQFTLDFQDCARLRQRLTEARSTHAARRDLSSMRDEGAAAANER
jgi:hypothetical protein